MKEGTAAVMPVVVVRATAIVAARTEVVAPVTGIAVVERAGKAAVRAVEVVKAAREVGITLVGTEVETAAVTGVVDMLEEVAA